MTQRISDRHEDDLGGRFLPFGETNRVAIDIIVDPDYAHLSSVQHAAWMLVNLLCRLEGVVDRIGLSCPDSVPVNGRVVPLAAARDLRTALHEGAAEIGIVPLSSTTVGGRRLIISPKSQIVGDMYVHGDGWCGGISAPQVTLPNPTSTLPFGPYIAACLAAGEVFKAARLKPESFNPISSAYYSCWSHSTSAALMAGGPTTTPLAVDLGLAGVGAVGNGFLHALWACPDIEGNVLLSDNDDKGIDSTNLNRYALFGRASVGQPKATYAAAILAQSPIAWCAENKAIEFVSPWPPRIVSAVDKNPARHAIQNRYPPRLLSGSTRDLRCEILRCGPPSHGACLACYNPVKAEASTHEKRRQLREAAEGDLEVLAQMAGISIADIKTFAESGKCGTTGERVLAHIRQNAGEEPHEFAVCFISVMAGTLLAAEALKDHLTNESPLSGSVNRAIFQFWSPDSLGNRAKFIARQTACAKCAPNTPAATIWADRFRSLAPQR